MAHLSKIFTKVPVDIPNRSGFDMSFENLLTMKVGTLTPVLCEEVIPNETYSLGYLSQIQLPPMATNFFGRVDLRLEAFFVPMRILWGGWQNFFTMPTNNPYGTPTVRPTEVPNFETNPDFGYPGELLDYLGIRNIPTSANTFKFSILPMVAYHRIYDEWYRNSKITKPAFVRSSFNDTATQLNSVGNLPWISTDFLVDSADAQNMLKLADGTDLFSLRQRCWAKDYFTTASLYPQADGTTVGATAAVSNGKISISSLRSANVLQRWLERNNIAGERYADQINAHFGVTPSDALIDRPIFLGSSKFGIYNRSVLQAGGSSTSQNPFNTLGTKGASTSGSGNASLFKSFHSTEHGYLIVLASIVPHANYASGMRRYLLHTKIGDFAFPLMQGLGEQAIYTRELNSDMPGIFGYQQQYSEYKYHDDEVHGLLRPGGSLDSFVLSRSFKSTSLNTDFVTIPQNSMDNVTAVKGDLSKYGAWADFYFSFKKVSPLSEYVQPTLGDLRNTHKENIDYRGKYL
nr:MAG: major capsid protein [Microvirus sp.]